MTYGPDDFIPLAEAVRIAFPAGGVKVSSLRLEASRGRLTVYRIAGKVMTTLADVRRMADRCRVEPIAPTMFGSEVPQHSDPEVARAALRMRLDQVRNGVPAAPKPSRQARRRTEG